MVHKYLEIVQKVVFTMKFVRGVSEIVIGISAGGDTRFEEKDRKVE